MLKLFTLINSTLITLSQRIIRPIRQPVNDGEQIAKAIALRSRVTDLNSRAKFD
ncbi:MAG: hypothetical protein AAFQ80_15935 [Cyanobacteria bacterium J06621_8]